MVKNAIKVYARLKPARRRTNVADYQIHHQRNEQSEEDVFVLTTSRKGNEYIDHRPESWNFSFARIFEENATQNDIFVNVAKPVIERYKEAMLSTGSGKTYTITGHQKEDDSHGIIPRCLHYLFDVIRKHPENLYSVEVAYLEIYNENGYDLLDRKQRREFSTRLEDLPRVSIQEDEAGRLHLKNLTFHRVGCEQDAYELLLVGDTNRVTADTPMNVQSSRSHCIFTIVVCTKEFGANQYKRAKIHLVDLAGSERVYKCAITGTILTEAKHINLSLHYLEQVIVCLGQESIDHIPYRNSLLTAILRDSLGGNCLTTMLATLSVSLYNLQETISTCRFAQRVALIKNDVKLVLEKDIESENMLLRLENERLKQEIEAMKKQNTDRELTAEEKEVLESRVRSFMETNSIICWDYDPRKIRYCFESLRKHFNLSKDKNSYLKKLEYYKNMVLQRDKEISLLINLLKKEREKGSNDVKHEFREMEEFPNNDTEVSATLKQINSTNNQILLEEIQQVNQDISSDCVHNVNDSETSQSCTAISGNSEKVQDCNSTDRNHNENNHFRNQDIQVSRTCVMNKFDTDKSIYKIRAIDKMNESAKCIRKNEQLLEKKKHKPSSSVMQRLSVKEAAFNESVKSNSLPCNVVNLSLPETVKEKDKKIESSSISDKVDRLRFHQNLLKKQLEDDSILRTSGRDIKDYSNEHFSDLNTKYKQGKKNTRADISLKNNESLSQRKNIAVIEVQPKRELEESSDQTPHFFQELKTFGKPIDSLNQASLTYSKAVLKGSPEKPKTDHENQYSNTAFYKQGYESVENNNNNLGTEKSHFTELLKHAENNEYDYKANRNYVQKHMSDLTLKDIPKGSESYDSDNIMKAQNYVTNKRTSFLNHTRNDVRKEEERTNKIEPMSLVLTQGHEHSVETAIITTDCSNQVNNTGIGNGNSTSDIKHFEANAHFQLDKHNYGYENEESHLSNYSRRKFDTPNALQTDTNYSSSSGRNLRSPSSRMIYKQPEKKSNNIECSSDIRRNITEDNRNDSKNWQSIDEINIYKPDIDNLMKSHIISEDMRVKNKKPQEEHENYENDKNFEKSLPLTGDPEIDEEIIAFYRAKRSGGTY